MTFAAIEDDLWRRVESAPVVETERWQGVRANTRTRELAMVDFQVDLGGVEDLDHWRREIQPNLPWADDHFEKERVSGQPLNPGEEWRNWPWGNSAAKFVKDQIFNHSYAERLWPKFARRTEGGKLSKGIVRKYPEQDARPRHGIAGPYGDLWDLVELLAKEPHTRQAWIPLFYPEDTGIADGGRKMCSLGYQVIVRDDRASIWYPLRSCDLLRHWRDDCYLAVRLLLWVIEQCRKISGRWERIVPGTYAMHMTSLHVFENDKRPN